jgi:hypothetical protein
MGQLCRKSLLWDSGQEGMQLAGPEPGAGAVQVGHQLSDDPIVQVGHQLSDDPIVQVGHQLSDDPIVQHKFEAVAG